MKSSANMHLPKEDNIPPSAGSLDLDLDSIFGLSPDVKKSPEKPKALCPECHKRGQESHLTPYQINFGEAIYLCPVQSCSYPMKESNLVENFVFKQDAASMPSMDASKVEKKSRKSSGYSTFFEEFDADSFFDFPTPSTQNIPAPEPSPRTETTNQDLANNLMVTGMHVSDAEKDPVCHMTGAFSHPCTNSQLVLDNPSNVVEDEVDGGVGSQLHNESADSIIIVGEEGTPTKEGGQDTPMDVELESPAVENVCDSDIMVHQDETCSVTDFEEESVPVSVSAPSSDILKIPSEAFIRKLTAPVVNNNMIQWLNEANSCWIDAIMQVLSNSNNARAMLNSHGTGERSAIKRMLVTYSECQNSYQCHLSKPEPNKNDVVKTLCRTLSDVRGRLLQSLKVKMSFESGEFQSLLEMFPLTLRIDNALENIFKVHLLWDFECENCGHKRARRSNGDIVSFPQTLSSFHPLNAQFHRHCYECKSPEGVMTIYMEKLPPCLAFHFQRGLPHSNLRVLDFAVQGHLYSVFAVVQYVINPFKHFVTWIRDGKTNKWVRCDDLKNPVCVSQNRQPKIPPTEIHMVFWERQLADKLENVKASTLATIINEEVTALSEEIPIELFFAHEGDEKIILSEDENAGSGGEIHDGFSSKTNKKPLISDLEQSLPTPQPDDAGIGYLSKHQCNVTPSKIPGGQQTFSFDSQLVSNTMVSTPYMHNSRAPSQKTGGQHTFNFEGQPASNTMVSTPNMHNRGSYPFKPSMFMNGGVTVIPDSTGRQTIQLVAPENTCSIYIVTNDNENQRYFHPGSQEQLNYSTQRRSTTPCSFIENSHSYNMVAHGIHGSMNNKGEGIRMPMQRLKRQYRLSGYSKLNSSNRFSPMKVSKPTSVTRASRNSTEALSDKSSNSRLDSETFSEVSELSDLLPDFEFDANSRHSSVVTPPPSLPNSRANTPTKNFN